MCQCSAHCRWLLEWELAVAIPAERSNILNWQASGLVWSRDSILLERVLLQPRLSREATPRRAVIIFTGPWTPSPPSLMVASLLFIVAS